MNDKATLDKQVHALEPEVLDELVRRIGDLNNAYRAIAEKAGQLYLKADEAGLSALTGMLDKPMRNASDNQQAFATLLSELQMSANRRG
jgi:hypothetical protein